MKFTFQQLYHALQVIHEPHYVYLEDNDGNDDLISQEDYEWLQQHQDDYKIVCVASEMTEERMGGDDLCDYVYEAIKAERAGYKIRVWYGDDAEVLIIGIRESDTREHFPLIEIDGPDAP